MDREPDGSALMCANSKGWVAPHWIAEYTLSASSADRSTENQDDAGSFPSTRRPLTPRGAIGNRPRRRSRTVLPVGELSLDGCAPRRTCTPTITNDSSATCTSTSSRAYKLLLLTVRGFAIVNVTRSVSASSAIQAFYDGIRHQPSTTFGNVKADVLADKDPDFKPANFCSMIRGSPWRVSTSQPRQQLRS